MKITTIPLAIILLGVIVIAMAQVFNDANANNLVSDTNISSTYNKLNDIAPIYKEVDDNIAGSGSDNQDGNFLTDISKMWASVKIFFESFGEVSEITNEAGQDLKVPEWVRTAGLSVITILFLGLLVSIAVRWKAN